MRRLIKKTVVLLACVSLLAADNTIKVLAEEIGIISEIASDADSNREKLYYSSVLNSEISDSIEEDDEKSVDTKNIEENRSIVYEKLQKLYSQISETTEQTKRASIEKEINKIKQTIADNEQRKVLREENTESLVLCSAPEPNSRTILDFKERTYAPSLSERYYNAQDNEFPYYTGNCTWYAYGRAYEITGKKPTFNGNANNFWNNRDDYAGYGGIDYPKVGAIACWGGNLGHVAVVEKVLANGNVVLSESSWGGVWYNDYSAWGKREYTKSEILNLKDADGNALYFQGYIYLLWDQDILKDFEFDVDEWGDYTLKKYKGNSSTVYIPQFVRDIDINAFDGCDFIDTVYMYRHQSSYVVGSLIPNIQNIHLIDPSDHFYEEDGALYHHSFDGEITLWQWPCGRTGDVYISDGVDYINDSAFSCSKASRIILSDNIKRDGYYNDGFDTGFAKSIYLGKNFNPNGIYFWSDDYYDYGYFVDSLSSIEVSSQNPYCYSSDGILYSKDSKTLIYYPQYKTNKSYVMPNSVEYLDNQAIYCNSYLQSITVSKNLREIGDYNVFKCSGVSLPQTVYRIGAGFDICDKVFVIPSGVTTIEEGSFKYSKNLTDIYIPPSVITIKSDLTKCSEREPWELDYGKTTKVVIHGKSGSYAETYAKNKGLRFVVFNDFDDAVVLENRSDIYQNGQTVMVPRGQFKINVKDSNGKGVALCNIKTISGLNLGTTDSNGCLSFDIESKGLHSGESYTVSVSTKGFISTNYSLQVVSGKTSTLVLPSNKATSIKPVIQSAVLIPGGNKANSIDLSKSSENYVALTNTVDITDSIYQRSADTIKITASGDVAEYQLIQNGRIIAKSNNPSISFDVYNPGKYVEGFDVGKTLYVRAVGTSGLSSDSFTVGINICSGAKRGGTSEFKLGFGDKVSFTLPDAVPLLGGQKIKMGFEQKTLPVEFVMTEDGIFKIGINCKVEESSSKSDFEKLKKKLKKANDETTLKNIAKDIASGKYNAGTFKATTVFAGYGEATFPKDNLNKKIKVNMNIILKITGEGEFVYYLPILVPVYLGIGGGVEATADMKCPVTWGPGDVLDWSAFDAKLSIGTFLKVSGGVGVKGFVCLGAEGKGTLTYTCYLVNDYKEVTFESSARVYYDGIFIDDDIWEDSYKETIWNSKQGKAYSNYSSPKIDSLGEITALEVNRTSGEYGNGRCLYIDDADQTDSMVSLDTSGENEEMEEKCLEDGMDLSGETDINCEDIIEDNEDFEEYDIQILTELDSEKANDDVEEFIDTEEDIQEYNVSNSETLNLCATIFETPIDSNKVLYALEQNVYSGSRIKYLRCSNGKEYRFWISDNPEKNSANRCTLVYSYSEDGTSWTEPIAIDDDGTADYLFDVKLDETTAKIVWMNCSEELLETVSLEECFSKFEIKYAEINLQENALSLCETLTNNDIMDVQPILTFVDGTEKIAWYSNSSNDANLSEGVTMINVATRIDDTWQITQIDSAQGTIYSFDAGILDGNYTLAYSAELDNNVLSNTNTEIFVSTNCEPFSRITNNDYADVGVTFLQNPNVQGLYWAGNDNLYYISSENSGVRQCFDNSAEDIFVSEDFSFVEGNNALELVWSSYKLIDEDRGINYLYCSKYDGAWSKPYEISKIPNMISVPSGYIDEADNSIIYFGGYADDFTTEYSHYSLKCNNSPLLEVVDCDFATDDINWSEAVPLNITVKNSGADMVDNAIVHVGEYNFALTNMLLTPQDIKTYTIQGWTLPSVDMTSMDISIEYDGKESHPFVLPIIERDIELSVNQFYYEESAYADMLIQNNGVLSSDVCLDVSDTETGEILYSQNIEELTNQENDNIMLNLSKIAEESDTKYFEISVSEWTGGEKQEICSELVSIGFSSEVVQVPRLVGEAGYEGSPSIGDRLYKCKPIAEFIGDYGQSVDGILRWVNPDEIITEDQNEYAWEFTPYNEKEYEIVSGTSEIILSGMKEIILDYQDGREDGKINVEIGKAVGDLPQPQRFNYMFGGWYTKANGQGIRIYANTIITFQKKLYAYWVDCSDGLYVEPIGEQIYTGNALKPHANVYFGERLLKEGKDYSLTYLNNINVAKSSTKKPSVVIKGKGNYTKSVVCYFDILPKQIGMDDITITIPDKAYTGKPVISKPVVKDGKMTLKENRDYILIYSDNVIDPGTVEVTIAAIDGGNYTGTTTATYSIYEKGRGISSMVVSSIPNQTYTGSEIDLDTLPLEVKETKKSTEALVRGTDYTVSYAPGSNTTNVGTATIQLKGISDRCVGTKTATFKIIPKALTADMIAVDNVVYIGAALKPDVILTDGENSVSESNYTVTYSNNTNVADVSAKKAPMATIKGKGNYTGTVKVPFNIEPRELAADDLSILLADIKDNKKPITEAAIKPTIKYANPITKKTITLKKGTDYTVNYARDIVNDNQQADIVFKGNYVNAEPITVPFRIYDAQTTMNTSDFIAEVNDAGLTYTGAKLMPRIVVKDTTTIERILTEGKDYTLSYSNNINAAPNSAKKAPTVKITGKGLYKGTITQTFSIQPMTLSESDFDVVIGDVLCNPKKEQTPKVTVTNKATKKALKSADYTITVDGSTKTVSEAIDITISGKGNYDGPINKTFRVYGTDIGKMAFDKIENQAYKGSAIRPAGDAVKVYADKKKTVKLTEGTDYVLEYGENIKAGSGSVIVKGIGNYGGSKTVKFTIVPKWLQWLLL